MTNPREAEGVVPSDGETQARFNAALKREREAGRNPNGITPFGWYQLGYEAYRRLRIEDARALAADGHVGNITVDANFQHLLMEAFARAEADPPAEDESERTVRGEVTVTCSCGHPMAEHSGDFSLICAVCGNHAAPPPAVAARDQTWQMLQDAQGISANDNRNRIESPPAVALDVEEARNNLYAWCPGGDDHGPFEEAITAFERAVRAGSEAGRTDGTG